MKVHLFGSLLCAGLLIVATSSGSYAEGDKKQPAKAGVGIITSSSNIKSPPAAITTQPKAGGGKGARRMPASGQAN
jgi:hypothetical protein